MCCWNRAYASNWAKARYPVGKSRHLERWTRDEGIERKIARDFKLSSENIGRPLQTERLNRCLGRTSSEVGDGSAPAISQSDQWYYPELTDAAVQHSGRACVVEPHISGHGAIHIPRCATQK